MSDNVKKVSTTLWNDTEKLNSKVTLIFKVEDEIY